MVSGKYISLLSRIGLLDRKMRVVNENTNDEESWLHWAERAFQSTYGYEFQGDNLLLARENLLYTFIDNLRYKLNREPTLKELKRIATIISWNLWQMDGITYSVPFSKNNDKMRQISLFELMGETGSNPIHSLSKIKDWRSGKTVEYCKLLRDQMYE